MREVGQIGPGELARDRWYRRSGARHDRVEEELGGDIAPFDLEVKVLNTFTGRCDHRAPFVVVSFKFDALVDGPEVEVQQGSTTDRGLR